MTEEEQETCQGCDRPIPEDEDEGEDGHCAECIEAMRPEECKDCGDTLPNTEIVDGRCPPCKKDLDEFEPVELVVEDLVTIERKVTIASPFCPNCGGDLRGGGGLVLVQYEAATQRTNLAMDDWSTSEGYEDHIPVAWQCGACDHVLIEAKEDRRTLGPTSVPS